MASSEGPAPARTSPAELLERHILRRFEICNRLGKGAYGVVWKVIDKKSRRLVALKKCFECFRTAADAQKTFREILYLQAFCDHENIVRLRHVIKSDSGRDMYLTFDFMDTDLHAVSRANILTEIQRKFVMWQLLRALKYIHSAEVIHRDLKPSNVLINADCQIKLCDFGLARSTGANYLGPTPELTEYISTRWYRAPELLLASTSYSKAVDIWAAGLLLGELINGAPVFPGLSVMNQLENILGLTQMPNAADIKAMKSPFAAIMVESIPQGSIKYKLISDIFPTASSEAIDVIRVCLLFNPESRPGVDDLLRHAYCADFHNEAEEIVYPYGQLILPLDDNVQRTAEEYREALYREVSDRRREMRRLQKEKESRLKKEKEMEDADADIRPQGLS